MEKIVIGAQQQKGMKKIHARTKLISNPIESSIWFSAPSPPPWIDLPTDVTANILHRVGPVEILESAQKVCATWWRVCKDPSMWQVISVIDDPDDVKDREISSFLATVCCRAVDRSQGGLTDLSIGSFCSDNLLSYISDRPSRLKRLTIARCSISGKAVIAAMKKFGGELEELRLLNMPRITGQDIEAIGNCCPLLNTFAFNNCMPGIACALLDDDHTLAIGKSMPNLRHLEVSMNAFTEKGLEAILDGCPCLESLDLRQSRVFGLEEGDLQKRCSWIKDVKLPSREPPLLVFG